MRHFSNNEIPEGWELIQGENSAFFEDELASEPCAEHLLYKKEAKVIARKSDRDDFLFYIQDLQEPYCVVHLTWQKETKPLWPSVTQFKNEKDFLKNWHYELYE